MIEGTQLASEPLALAGRYRIQPVEALILLVTVFFPVNYSLAFKLRISDIFILMLVVVSLPWIRWSYSRLFFYILAFFALFSISMVYGVMTRGVVTPTNMLFIYKYAIAFLLFWVLTSVPLSPRGVERIRKTAFLIYFLLIGYVFLYVIRYASGVRGVSIRVSFPFSNVVDPTLSDAPLYSVVLSTCFIGYLFFPRESRTKTRVFVACVCLLTVAAIMFSGSRTGLLSIPLTLALYGARKVYRGFLTGRLRLRPRVILLIVVLAAAAAVILIRSSSITDNTLAALMSRALSFNLGGDASVGARVEKSLYVIENIFQGPILIGIGMQSTFHTWFDNTYSAVLFTTGPLGLVLFLMIIVGFLRTVKVMARRSGTMRSYDALEYLFINYMICGITSEYFLVTRGLVPFAVLAAVYYHTIKNSEAAESPASSPGKGLIRV